MILSSVAKNWSVQKNKTLLNSIQHQYIFLIYDYIHVCTQHTIKYNGHYNLVDLFIWCFLSLFMCT